MKLPSGNSSSVSCASSRRIESPNLQTNNTNMHRYFSHDRNETNTQHHQLLFYSHFTAEVLITSLRILQMHFD